MPNPDNYFKKGDQKAINAGKKSKRKPHSVKLREAAEELVKEGLTIDDAITQALLKKALQGDLKAIEMYYDRTGGRPKQSIAHEGEMEQNLNVIFSDKLKDV